MPIYEYECEKCGEKFELMRSFSADDKDIQCPKCEANHPKRSISLFASSGNSDLGCTPASSGG